MDRKTRMQTLNDIQDCMDEASTVLARVNLLPAEGLMMHEAFYIMNGVQSTIISIGRKIAYIGTIKHQEPGDVEAMSCK